MSDGQPLSFEDALQQLHAAVEALEAGGLTLEESVALFAQGMALVEQCSRQLDQTELRVIEIEEALADALTPKEPPLVRLDGR
jgi:exodeoxyribonuclease VII small subunit